MKNLLIVTFCILSIAAMSGCSTKFNVAAPYKNITIIYGLLDEGDTAHYIRIQKAFLSQTLSAYDMDKVSDSSFYPQLNVVLKAFNNGSQVGTITLNRVDLNLEGYQKDSGTFFTTPNYAYKTTAALDPNNTYRLIVTNPANGAIDSGETNIIDESPKNFSCAFLDIAANSLEISHYNGTLSVKGSVPSTVAYMEGILRVRWVEKNSQTNTTVKKYADWNFANLTPSGNGGGGNTNGYNLQANNADFYTFLETAMQPAPAFVTRLMDSAQLYLYAANSDFYNYMQVTQSLGTGLTGMDIEPTYTTLKCNQGPNVYGLFSSRGLRTGQIAYNVYTIDSIVASPYVQDLKITGSTY